MFCFFGFFAKRSAFKANNRKVEGPSTQYAVRSTSQNQNQNFVLWSLRVVTDVQAYPLQLGGL